MKLLVLFLILPTLIYTINVGDDSSQEEQFGIADTKKDSDKEFETKAHHTTGSFYYVLNKNQPQTRRNDFVQPSPNTRPVWRPLFVNNNQLPAQTVQNWPRRVQPNVNFVTTQSPTTFPTLPPVTPKDIPEQLRLLGSNILADLIERADLTDALQSRGPFTVFAPTDAAFEKLIDMRSDEYKNIILGDKTLLQYILLQHVTPELLRSGDLSTGMRIETLAENSLTVLNTRDGLTIGGSLFTKGGLNQVAMNGIIHSINDVIYPYVSDEEATTPRPEFTRLFAARDDDPRLVVRTQAGRIRGVNLSRDVRAWLGVPYAEPPVGRYIFSRPRQLRPWDRDFTKETKTLPKACPQTPDAFFANFSGSQQWNPNTEIGDDCLYLNVWAPKDIAENENLPVLVWIYGGGYMTGSSSLEIYDPQEIVKLGKVIFVSMQYRVGAHGFLYFGPDSSAPGNVGLLDQTLALEWVRDNIERFGGNPEEVTIMGESAGANSVALHMMSPLSCGLFNRAILQSSGATPRWGFVTNEEALKRSVKLADELGCNYNRNDVEQTLECLRDRPHADITAKEYNVAEYILNFFPFVPTIDETFLPASPKTLMKNGLVKDISILIGNNANEGYWSLMYLLPSLFPNNELKLRDRDLTQDMYQATVDSIFNFYPKSLQKLIGHEYSDKFAGSDRLFKALDLMAGDVDMSCNTEEFAQKMSERGNRVYRYFYNHQSSVDPWPTWSGAKHGDELEFTFALPMRNPELYSAKEIKFARDIITYWTNFVKNGSPNPSNALQTWPEYQAPQWKYLNLTAGSTGLTGQNSLNQQCRFFNDIIPEFLESQDFDEDNALRGSAATRLTCK